MAKVDFSKANAGQLPSILDVQMRCPKCGLITMVRDAEPDIDGDGSLGCPKCLYVMKEKIPLTEQQNLVNGV